MDDFFGGDGEEPEEVPEEPAAEEEEPAAEGEEEPAAEEEDGDGNPCCQCCLGLILFPVALALLAWNEVSFVCNENQILTFSEAKDAKCSEAPSEGSYFMSCTISDDSKATYDASFLLDGVDGVDDAGIYQPNWPQDKLVAWGEAKSEQLACIRKSTKKKSGKQTTTVVTYEKKWVATISWTRPNLDKYPTTGGTCGTKTEAGQGAKGTPFGVAKWATDETKADQITLSDAARKAWVATASRETVTVEKQGAEKIADTRASVRFLKSDVVTGFVHFDSAKKMVPIAVAAIWGCDAKESWSFTSTQTTKDERIAQLNSANGFSVKLFRVAGWILSMCAIYCILSPIAYAADKLGDLLNFIPCIGSFLEDFIEGVVDCILYVISCLCGSCCSLFTIAIAWVIVRPLVGGAMLAVCLVMMGIMIYARSGAEKKSKRRGGDMEMGQPMQGQQQVYDVVVPMGAQPGDPVPFVTPDGRTLQATVPDGYVEGQAFQVQG